MTFVSENILKNEEFSREKAEARMTCFIHWRFDH